MDSRYRWQDDALCKGQTYLFFNADDLRTVNQREAKAICSRCTVRNECMEWGIKHELFGIWGGLNPKERRLERQKRRIAIDPLSPFQDHSSSKK